ncbi:MAG TPA: MarC family protein [Desulfomonilia bacterium]
MIYHIFKYSTNLLHFLGNLGMSALIRIMGLFTLAIGVQFILDGVSKFFPGLMGTM